jgi:hypothetical protein
MKKAEWCGMNGITTKQFYYWQKRVRAQALEEMQGGTGMGVSMQSDGLPAQLPSFVELKPPAQPCCSCDVDTPVDAPDAPAPLTLNLKDCQLQIRGNASESLLRMVVKVLRDA